MPWLRCNLWASHLYRSSKPQKGAGQSRLTGGPYFLKTGDKRTGLLRIFDDQRRTLMVGVKAVQEMPAIGNDQRIHRHARLRSGFIDRDGRGISPQQIQQARTGPFHPARVMQNEFEARGRRSPQERGNIARARRGVPPGLRKIDIEHLQFVPRQCRSTHRWLQSAPRWYRGGLRGVPDPWRFQATCRYPWRYPS